MNKNFQPNKTSNLTFTLDHLDIALPKNLNPQVYDLDLIGTDMMQSDFINQFNTYANTFLPVASVKDYKVSDIYIPPVDLSTHHIPDIVVYKLADKLPTNMVNVKFMNIITTSDYQKARFYGWSVNPDGTENDPSSTDAGYLRGNDSINLKSTMNDIYADNTSCGGDSGSPLLSLRPNGDYELLGLASYIEGANGNLCANRTHYVKVANYADWLINVVNETIASSCTTATQCQIKD